MISATSPDWIRERPEGWQPGKLLLKSIRDYQSAAASKSFLRAKLAIIRHRFWTALTSADIPLNCRIGGGLLLPHPTGVVIHPGAKIGPNCLIFQQVTIGCANGVPQIGGHVDIGAGAKLIGPIRIGDHAKIGANAVVTTDVPAGATAVGIPARVVRSRTPVAEVLLASSDANIPDLAQSRFATETIAQARGLLKRTPQMADILCAQTDAAAQHIAELLLGLEAVAKWSIYREEGTDRIVVCRNFHATGGEEVVEYLDEIDPAEARATEAKYGNVTRRTIFDLACVRAGAHPQRLYAEDLMAA